MNKLKLKKISIPHSSDFACLTKQEITYDFPAPVGFAVKCVIAAAVCFMASFGKMVGFPSYMNVTCAVISGKYSAAALLGAIVSYAVQDSFSKSAVQLAAIIITVAMNIFFPYFTKEGEPIRSSLYTVSVTLILSCVINAVTADSFSVSMRIISSLMCACTVYAAAFIIERAKSGDPMRVEGLTAVYLTMLYIVIIATLSSCQIGLINIGRSLSCAVIPLAAKKKRASGGAVIGALTAVSVTLCSSSLAINTMLLAAAGLICSAFADFGRVAVSLSFMLSASAALATTGLNGDTFNMLADIIMGAAIFTALPSHFPAKLLSGFVIMNSPADNAGQTASSRLTFASMTISDIKDKLTKVSDTVEAKAETVTLADRVIREACLDCRLYDECLKNGCMKNLRNICGSDSDDAASSATGCIRRSQLAEIIGKCRDEQLSDRADSARLKEMQIFLREQLSAMSDILNDLSCRLSHRRTIDSKLSSAAKLYFEKQGYKGVRACVYTDENCCAHAEVYLSGDFDGDSLTLTAGLCRVLECDFELPGITHANSLTKLEFDEVAPFSADIGSYNALGSNGSCSGDTLESVRCSTGETYVLMSDGMGSGKRARLDSAMSVNLAGRLLQSGMSMSTAQRIINSVMMVKDWEESFATLDFLRLDLFSGRAEFLKSGAAPAYLCRDGGMMRIDCDSFPAGILTTCDPDVCSCKLFGGDVLIMATDGAPEEAVSESARIAFENPEANARQLACIIGGECTAIAGEKNDDITVAVVKISYKKQKIHL